MVSTIIREHILMDFQYFDKAIQNLLIVKEQEADNIAALTDLLYTTVQNKNSIYLFGAGHAGIITQEMYYRAGGFMLFNPIMPRELSLDNEPINITSQIERLEGYGRVVAMKAEFNKDDVIIIHSVSGRNSAGIDMALVAREHGCKVVSITNVGYSQQVTSRHSSGLRLFEASDLVIDNHGDLGDAICTLEGSEQRVAASSTVVGASILHEVTARLAQRMVDEGVEHLPFFYSANIDGGDQKNAELFKVYKDQIHYKFKL